MKKKLVVLTLTATMIVSGLSANTFASDFEETSVSMMAEMEQTDGEAAEFSDSEVSDEMENSSSEGAEFADSETSGSGSDTAEESGSSGGEFSEGEQEAAEEQSPTPSEEPTPTIAPEVSPTSVPTPTITPEAAPTCTPTSTVTPEVSPTRMPTPTPTRMPSFLTYQSGSLKWISHSAVSLKFSTTQNVKWCYFYVNDGTDIRVIQNMYDSSLATNAEEADTEFTITAENVPEQDSWLVVCVKPDSGEAKAKMSIFKLNTSAFKAKRPAKSGLTIRAARTYDVSKSMVTGLEKPLKFTPGTFYKFTVTGAGQNDEKPYVSGDERWIPLYWSMKSNPSSADKNTVFRIGSPVGIKVAKTYTIYIFFKKQVFNGTEWEDTDVIQSITRSFTSVAIKENSSSPSPKVNLSSLVLSPGQSTSVVRVTNATSSFRVVAWYSDNTSIARVDSHGKITAGKRTGSTYIKIAMSTGKTARVKVTVQKGIVRTKSISGLKSKYTVAKGKTVTLKPVRSPITSQEKITYSSSNKNVASVSSKGVIKGIKAGTAKITVRSGSKKVTVTVNVPKVSTQKISGVKSAITLKKGKTFKISPKLSPSNSDDKISYSSSNSKIVTINSKGVISAKKKGTAMVTVKSGKVQVKCKVTVK